MDIVTEMERKVLNSGQLTREEMILLAKEHPNRLADAANHIRKHFCGQSFDLCTIVSAKCGGCSEDCIYCAQSVHHPAEVFLSYVEEIEQHLSRIAENYSLGAVRCGFVNAGKTLTGEELRTLLTNYQKVHRVCKISLCASHGLLTAPELRQLKGAGVFRYHANLETSQRYFPHVCTTHVYEDKIPVITAAQQEGLEVVCSRRHLRHR